MVEQPPNPELLSALGRLARGLSTLFWGLPTSLVVCVQSAKGDWFRPLGVLPPLAATALLLYGVILLGHFQKQERVWRSVLERAKLLALINVGISPFLYWWNRIPSHPFFSVILELLMFSGLMFLILLNSTLVRLTSMLPDEMLRAETRLFAMLNRSLLLGLLLVLAFYFTLLHIDSGLPEKFMEWLMKTSPLPRPTAQLANLLDRGGQWIAFFFVLVPVAMTMALLWKIKEVILASVFGPEH
jgi:hypothetical protein